MEYQPVQSTFSPNGTTPPDTLSTVVPHDTSTWSPVDTRAIKKARDLKLRALSKTFGNIPGVPIFTHWNTRLECSGTAVHRSTVAGIYGNKRDGTYSLALSNLYKDNEDGGDIIIYTGAGGRKKWSDTFPPKRLRVGPQIMDQSWEECRNGALIRSLDTGNPIRVIRSWRSSSRYAPLKGYRYDGLYKVAACWTAKGHNGKDICRCRLERLPDQAPIPLRPITVSTRPTRKRRRLSQHHSVTANTESYTEGTELNPPVYFSENTVEESVRPPSPPQQRAMSEASTLIDFDMAEIEQEIKASPQLSPEPPCPAAQPRHRGDPVRSELVMIQVQDPQPMSEDLAAAGEEEPLVEDISIANDEDEDEVDEHRVEDDVTLLPLGTDSCAIDLSFWTEGEL